LRIEETASGKSKKKNAGFPTVLNLLDKEMLCIQMICHGTFDAV
jgi:hypothetical protein